MPQRPRVGERLPCLLIIPGDNLPATATGMRRLKGGKSTGRFNEDNEKEAETSTATVHPCSSAGLITSALKRSLKKITAATARRIPTLTSQHVVPLAVRH